MKRIIPFSLYLLLISLPVCLSKTPVPLPAKNTDTISNNFAGSKSLILRGSLSTFHANYGKNYFELNWNTVAGDFDHFEIERSLDGLKYETIGTVENTAISAEGQYTFRDHFRSSVG